jgi:hypothetical protein
LDLGELGEQLETGLLYTLEGCNKCVGPGNRIGALDFGAGKDVVEMGLTGGCVWKKTQI